MTQRRFSGRPRVVGISPSTEPLPPLPAPPEETPASSESTPEPIVDKPLPEDAQQQSPPMKQELPLEDTKTIPVDTPVDAPAGVPPPDSSEEELLDLPIPKFNLSSSFQYNCAQLTAPLKNGRASYIVELQPNIDEERKRNHIRRIQQLCASSGNQDTGIEAQLDSVISGYVGVFTAETIDQISKENDIVRSITANQPAEVYGKTITMRTENWGASRISMEGSDWRASADGDGMWPYKVSLTEKDGKNTMIFLVDEGAFDRNDFIQPSRLAAGQASETELAPTHATMMASIMAGDTFGLARRAKFWLYNATRKLTKVSVLLAWEAIAKYDLQKANVKQGAGIMCLPFGFADTAKDNHALARALHFLMESKGIKVVVAAPNNNEYIEEYQSFPQNVAEVILVGGSCQHNKLAPTSDWGPTITLYAPAVDIKAMKSQRGHLETSSTWGKLDSIKGTADGNCFAAAHVCGLISLILSDDDCVVTQAGLKSALVTRFTETTEIKSKGKVPIKVLKKFMQPFQKESKPRHGAFRDVSAEAPLATSLRIQRLTPENYEIKLRDCNGTDSALLNKRRYSEFMKALQADIPDYKAMAIILGDGSSDSQAAIAAGLRRVGRVTISWNINQGSGIQEVHKRHSTVKTGIEEFACEIGNI